VEEGALRDLLTGLAILLLACLTGALIAPHVIDWDSRRAMISAELSSALGQPVTINGPIGVELLPTPTLKLSHISLGEGGNIQGNIGRFRLRMAIPPLLRGEIRITQALLQGADLKINPASGTSKSQSPVSGSWTSVGFDKLLIQDSRLSLARPDGAEPLRAERVNGQVEATSLLGPFRGSIGFDLEGGRRFLRFSTGRVEGNTVRLKALLEHELVAARTEYDGVLRYDNGTIAGEGALAASGNAAFPAGEGTGHVIWRLAAKVKGAGAAASLDSIELVLGNTERQTVFTGNGDIDLSRASPAKITLSTRQIDLDRLLGGEDSKLTQSPEKLLRSLVSSAVPSEQRLAILGDLDVTVGSLLVGGDVIIGPRLVLHAEAGRVGLQHISGELPGRTQIWLESSKETSSETLAGKLSLESRDLAKLSAWYHSVPARPVGLRSLNLQGDLRQGPQELSISNATLVADDMRLAGSIQLNTAGERQKLTLRLTADQLDIAKVPEIPGGESATNWDLDLGVEARRVRYAGVGAGDINLRFRREGDAAFLDELRITNLGGANLTAKGMLGGSSPKLEARLQATRLEALLQLADRVSSHPAMPLLASRAIALAPADLTIGLAAVGTNPGERILTVRGNANATDVDVSARLRTNGALADGNSLSVAVKSLGPSSLIRQIGLEAIPITGAGPVDLRLTGGGLSNGIAAADWTARGIFAGLALDIAARQTINPAEPLNGTIRLSANDLSPLAQSLLIAVPAVTPGQNFALTAGFDLRGYRITLREFDLTTGGTRTRGEITFNLAEFGRVSGQLRMGRLDASAFAPLIFGEPQGEGLPQIWGAARFSAPAPITLPGDLWIEAEGVDLGEGLVVNNPKFVLRFENGLIYIDHAEGEWMNGRLKAQATLRRNLHTVSITGRFGLEGWHLDRIPVLAANSSLRGRASAQLDLSATGESPLGLMTALAGNGRLDIQSAEVSGLAPGALDGILKTPQGEFAAVSRETLAVTLRQRLNGPLALPAGPMPLTIGAGVLRAGPLRVASADEVATTSLALDLKDMSVLARTGLVAREAPKGWSGPLPSADLVLRGPLRNPVREIDVASLANGLTAIAIARETERIEAIEQDQRERGFFNRQLRASEEQRRAEEDARRKLEAARRLAEDQRRKDEAARREAPIPTPPPITLEPPLLITPPAVR
jgi:AsmA family/AsmA-like C-terminal region